MNFELILFDQKISPSRHFCVILKIVLLVFYYQLQMFSSLLSFYLPPFERAWHGASTESSSSSYRFVLKSLPYHPTAALSQAIKAFQSLQSNSLSSSPSTLLSSTFPSEVCLVDSLLILSRSKERHLLSFLSRFSCVSSGDSQAFDSLINWIKRQEFHIDSAFPSVLAWSYCYSHSLYSSRSPFSRLLFDSLNLLLALRSVDEFLTEPMKFEQLLNDSSALSMQRHHRIKTKYLDSSFACDDQIVSDYFTKRPETTGRFIKLTVVAVVLAVVNILIWWNNKGNYQNVTEETNEKWQTEEQSPHSLLL